MRDAVVIGGGPAGMAAAAILAENGATVTLCDEQLALGGQIYRRIEDVARFDKSLLAALGPDYVHGLELVRRFRQSGAEYLPSSVVWRVERNHVFLTCNGASARLDTRTVILATGAMERPVPIPGWTLPGVMPVGGVQILLKSGSLVPDEPIVLIGSGPLLYLFACQCLDLGVKIATILNTTSRANMLASLVELPRAISGKGLSYLLKGAGLLARIRRHGVRVYRRVSDIRIDGEAKVTGVSFRSGSRRRHIETAFVALHEGVIPMQHMTRGAGCAHIWDQHQSCYTPILDRWGNSSVDGVLVAGDAARIGGARAAEYDGQVVAVEVLHRLGRIDATERDRLAHSALKSRDKHRSVRPFLDRLYQPPQNVRSPCDDAIICRCEAVTAGQIRHVVRLGCQGPNQVKSFLRVGMGPCQGRTCGTPLMVLIAATTGQPITDLNYFNVRSPLKPVTLGQLADMTAL